MPSREDIVTTQRTSKTLKIQLLISAFLFWFGLLIGGAPSFGSGAAALGPAIMGGVGVYAIYGIMAGATKRLDGKQREAYGGQPTFDAWVARTGGLFPRLGDAGAAGQTTYNV